VTSTPSTPNPLPTRFVTAREVQVEVQPWCTCEWLCRPGLVDAEHLLLVRAHMPPGEAHLFHRHPSAEEVIYVLEGRAEQWVGRERRVLGPGDVAHIPTDVVHATLNAGDGVLRFLAILSPARFDGPPTIDVAGEEPWLSIVAKTRDGRAGRCQRRDQPPAGETISGRDGAG